MLLLQKPDVDMLVLGPPRQASSAVQVVPLAKLEDPTLFEI
jgi:hypothetical protein